METAQAIRTEKINQTFYTSRCGVQVVGELEYRPAKYGQIQVAHRSWLVYDEPVSPDQPTIQPTTSGEYHRFFDPYEAITRVNEVCGGNYTVDDLTYAMEDRIKTLQRTTNQDMVPEHLSNFRTELRWLLDKYGIDLQRSWEDDVWCEYILTMNGQEASRGTLRDLVEDLVN